MKPETRDAVRPGVMSSAEALLPVILEYAPPPWPTGLLDVGAGEGHWMVEYRRHYPGGSCLGVDVEELKPRESPAADEHGWPWVMPWDAENGDPLPLRAGPHPKDPNQTAHFKWPLALCLETAEHVDADAGQWLIGELCRVADVIAWSAAIPGQGGDGHKTERWPAYWASLFREQGYALIDPFRDAIWADARIEPWYRQNTLLAVPASAAWPDPRALVHPEIWAWYR